MIESSTEKELREVQKTLDQEHEQKTGKPLLSAKENDMFSQILRDDMNILREFRGPEEEGSAQSITGTQPTSPAETIDNSDSDGQKLDDGQDEAMPAGTQPQVNVNKETTQKESGSGTKISIKPVKKILFGARGSPATPGQKHHRFRDIQYQQATRSPKRRSPKHLSLERRIHRSKNSTQARPFVRFQASKNSSPRTKSYVASRFQLREDSDGENDGDENDHSSNDDGDYNDDGYETDVSPIRRRGSLRLSASQPSPVKKSNDNNSSGNTAIASSSTSSLPGLGAPVRSPRSNAPATAGPSGIRRRPIRASATPVPTYNTKKVFKRLVGSLDGPEYQLV